MEIIYLNRDQYKQKNQAHFLAHLKETYKAYIIPEGGANAIGVNACADINHFFAKKNYDVVALSAGTGAMAGGLLNQLPKNIKLWVFSSLKGGDFLTNDILQWIPEENKEAKKNQMQLELDYHFGGFAKYNPSLIAFLQSFYGQTAIKLDSIYNGKMAYGICQKLASHNSKIKLLMIHCGGLQGIDGVERKLGHRVY